MANRTRRKQMNVFLSEKEMKELDNKAKRTGLSKSVYVRQLIMDIQPKERTATDLLEVLKELRQISINMSRLAIQANTTGLIDADAYWDNSRRLQESISEIKQRSV
ncbi:MAG: ribbon-helix-helix protein, CopG family [Eubacteriaceae bacterium]|nr:ribbon-helix-helix protein, CopG family [Eubacteriaceae bacterium]